MEAIAHLRSDFARQVAPDETAVDMAAEALELLEWQAVNGVEVRTVKDCENAWVAPYRQDRELLRVYYGATPIEALRAAKAAQP